MKGFSLNCVQLQEYQPNRYPFLMIDHVDEVVPGKSAKGYKNLKEDEWFFKVHWPDDPNMPGMLQIEALVQMCALSILSLPGNKGKVMYLTSANNMKFIKKIIYNFFDKYIQIDKNIIDEYLDEYINFKNFRLLSNKMAKNKNILNYDENKNNHQNVYKVKKNYNTEIIFKSICSNIFKYYLYFLKITNNLDKKELIYQIFTKQFVSTKKNGM